MEANKITNGNNVPDVMKWGMYVFREVGMTGALIAVIVYLLLVQLPDMRQDFRIQTDKLVGAVENNNRIMNELSDEIRQMRQERWNEWQRKQSKQP